MLMKKKPIISFQNDHNLEFYICSTGLAVLVVNRREGTSGQVSERLMIKYLARTHEQEDFTQLKNNADDEIELKNEYIVCFVVAGLCHFA